MICKTPTKYEKMFELQAHLLTRAIWPQSQLCDGTAIVNSLLRIIYYGDQLMAN